MQIDFSAPILDLDGKPAIDRDMNGAPIVENGVQKILTLGLVSTRALLAQFSDDDRVPGDKKAHRFTVAMKAHEGGKQDLAVEDIAELKALIARAFSPLIVGRSWALIESKGGK